MRPCSLSAMARRQGGKDQTPEPGSLQAIVFERERALERGAQIAAGKLLERLRDVKGQINQSEAARQTGMDQQTLSALVSGEKIGRRGSVAAPAEANHAGIRVCDRRICRNTLRGYAGNQGAAQARQERIDTARA